MLKVLFNLPIFRRLFIAFTLAAILPGIVIALLGTYFVSTLDQRGQAERTSFDAQSVAFNQQVNLQRMNALIQARHAQVFASISGNIKDPSLAASGMLINNDILTREIDFDQTLTKYQHDYQLATSSTMSPVRNILLSDQPGTTIMSDQQAVLDKVVKEQWPAYKQLQDQELALLQTNPPYSKAYPILFAANAKFLDLKNSWQQVVNIAENMGKIVTTVGSAETQPILAFTTIALFCTILLVVTTGYVVNITITKPLRQLATLTKRIARGNTGARANVAGHDEISLVASSMNNMLDNIVRLIQEVQFQRDNLQAQVEKLVSEVSGVGEGELRVQAEVTADALGVLADSFNYMVEELGSLVVRVKMVAHEVESSTVAIFDRLTQLVETGDIQLNQIGEAVVEVEHMADSSRQVANRANILYNVASDAQQSAQSGREAVQEAVEGMERIHQNVQATASKVQTLGERSREINNIVEVISGIAHQTNRLALDAAIQAAMAGENGKGFGAVAADIRRLAERSKDQASMIAKIVRSVREDIGAAAVSMQDTERETSTGSQLAQEAGTSLESIFGVVERQASEIEAINRMAAHQLNSASAVVQIMHEVSASTQQSGFSTRNASQNMERLTRLVEQLRASVEAFKMRENQGYFANKTSVNEEETDTPLTFSSIFRTVSATAQSSPSAQPSRIAATKIYEAPIDQVSEHPAWDWGNASTQSGQQWYILGKQPENGNNSW